MQQLRPALKSRGQAGDIARASAGDGRTDCTHKRANEHFFSDYPSPRVISAVLVAEDSGSIHTSTTATQPASTAAIAFV